MRYFLHTRELYHPPLKDRKRLLQTESLKFYVFLYVFLFIIDDLLQPVVY